MNNQNSFLISNREGIYSEFSIIVHHRPQQRGRKRTKVRPGSKVLFVVDSDTFPITSFSIQAVNMLMQLDKLSGGYAAWFSRTKVHYPSTNIPILNTTGYSYMIEHNADLIGTYIDNVHRNNRLFYDLIQKSCSQYVTHVPKNIKMIAIDNANRAIVLADHLYACRTKTIVIGFRPSWGFRHCVITEIHGKMRFSVGASLSEREVYQLASCYCRKTT
jgi:hypothetical protein